MGLFKRFDKNSRTSIQIDDVSSIEIGDHIRFGQYMQDTGSFARAKPVIWRVLAKEENRILVISEYGLEAMRFKEGIWENCEMRKWLNNDFLNNSFSDTDKDLIPSVLLKNEDNSEYDVKGGNDTTDKVFLLSISEADAYFSSNSARKCIPTAYTVSKRAAVKNSGRVVITDRKGNNQNYDIGSKTCLWYLRSPGSSYSNGNAVVDYDGSISAYGKYQLDYYTVIRPALWINL